MISSREGDDSERFVTLGHVAGVYGVRGWLRIHSETSPRENIVNYSPWYLLCAGRWTPWAVEHGKRHGKGMVIKLVGCDDRDVAGGLVGFEIGVKRCQLADELTSDEYYWTDLEGMRVVNKQGIDLGQVERLLETGANDVLVVRGDRERLIPFLREQVVLDVDMVAGKIEVDWDPEF